jgi:hypothetical protein
MPPVKKAKKRGRKKIDPELKRRGVTIILSPEESRAVNFLQKTYQLKSRSAVVRYAILKATSDAVAIRHLEDGSAPVALPTL